MIDILKDPAGCFVWNRLESSRKVSMEIVREAIVITL